MLDRALRSGALVVAATSSCGGVAVLDASDPCGGAVAIESSLGALQKAKCAVLDQPELVLVEMSNLPNFAVEKDGTSRWGFRFEGPSTYVEVSVVEDQVVTFPGTVEDPCTEEITPFDGEALVPKAIPLLDASIQDDPSLALSKAASCWGYFDHQGKAVLAAWGKKSATYWFYPFDDAEQPGVTCGPCGSLDPKECGCVF